MRVDYSVAGQGPLTGCIKIPGDKSVSHRALMLGAIAKGKTHIKGFLDGEDTIATLEAFRAMGVSIDHHQPQQVTIQGTGLHGLREASGPLYLGNSGTSVRLLSGLLAGQAFDSELTGDESLIRRPMRRVTEPLRQMGADIHCSEQGTLPIRIWGGRSLSGINYQSPVASAQVKSALLLAGLYASGRTCITEPGVTRDHTERMLQYFGVPVERSDQSLCITSGVLTGRDIEVPADISSAAFFMVGASIIEGSDLFMERIGINPTRSAIIDILRAMGADIRLENRRDQGGEPMADVRVVYHRLKGVEISPALVSVAMDEFPAIFIAAACAEGRTVLAGAAELRVKESDRIAAMEAGLSALGIRAQGRDDGMIVEGGRLRGGVVDSHGDHRIAMAFTIAGLASSGPVTIRDCANIDTSFPGFAGLLEELGSPVTINTV